MTNHEQRVTQPSTTEEGTIRVSAFDLPVSSLLDAQSRMVLRRVRQHNERLATTRPQGLWSEPEVTLALRAFNEREAHEGPLKQLQALYDVRIQPKTIAGVYTEVFTPDDGVAPRAAERVLINLHGGAFSFGAGYAGQVESIPVAALGRIKVISVHYRMAPEHEFPAATDDVVAVYRALLTQHAPQNIGIYGFSAGAMLTAQTVARLQSDELPVPGAVGMLGGAACHWAAGDSGAFSGALMDRRVESLHEIPYLRHADPNDPQVQPVHFPEVLARFPPSLLITATRDVSLSSVVHTHSRLVALGVQADLHLWEGVGHSFLYEDAELPQAREGHEVIRRFFDRHLGRRRPEFA
jgi:epsilon-lactone hydrolase